MTVRAKMKCYSVEHLKDGKPDTTLADIRMMPVYDDGCPENRAWSKATPSGEVRLFVTNPDAIANFEPGKSYYVDFTPVD
jgi:hypothetical protein